MLHFLYSKQLEVDSDSEVFAQISSAGIAAYDDKEAFGRRLGLVIALASICPISEVRRRICDWVPVMMPNLVVMGDHRQWGPLASAISGLGRFRGRT